MQANPPDCARRSKEVHRARVSTRLLDMRVTQPTREPNVSGTIVAVVTQTWLFLCLLFASEPMIDPFLGMLPLFFGLGLALSWLFVLVPAGYRSWKASRGARRQKVIGYLIPFPLAAILLLVLVPLEIPLKARFELSEAALSNFAEQHASTDGESFSGSEWVGLFKVDNVFRRDGCFVLQTHSFIDESAGLAYCDGSLPRSPTVHMHHLEGPWWRYRNIH